MDDSNIKESEHIDIEIEDKKLKLEKLKRDVFEQEKLLKEETNDIIQQNLRLQEEIKLRDNQITILKQSSGNKEKDRYSEELKKMLVSKDIENNELNNKISNFEKVFLILFD